MLENRKNRNKYGKIITKIDIKSKLHIYKYESIFNYLPVPETDTGRKVEYTKGRERTLLKELGKMTL
jgi:hypothetical protein